MQHEAIDGIVVRVKDYNGKDRYLSVLTAEQGRITLLSKGSKSMSSGQAAVSQLYTYGNFEYYRRGDFKILKGGTSIHAFYALSADIDRLDLAAYFCELTVEVTDEGEPAEEMLRLLLNSLYAVSRDVRPQEIIKGAFEFRVATMSGYAPDLSGCCYCGCDMAEQMYLDVMNGAVFCADCLHKRSKPKMPIDAVYDEIREAELLCPITPAILAAMRYVACAPIERIFSFDLKDQDDLIAFSKTTESYLLSHLGRGFDSLDFYHSMRAGKLLPVKKQH